MKKGASILEGVTVLDFTQYLAGPACTRLMVELGADVIKVEQPPYGDPMRAQGPRKNRRSGSFIQQNRGKRDICVDLSTDEGVTIVKALVGEIDVVVENFTPGVMARRGLDYDSLCELNPDLIMASVSGFGQTGTMSSRPTFDFIAQAYSGMMHVTGHPDGPPLFVGAGLGDTNAGVHAFAALGYALFHRDRTGEGTHIDISMVDSLFHMHENSVQATSITDGEYVPVRAGRHYGPVSPAGSFRGPDGWIVMLCGINQMDNLWRALNAPEFADDARFATNESRIENREALTEIIERWMSGFDSDADVLSALTASRVPCGPVMSPADAITDDYYVSRKMVREVDDPLTGPFTIPGFPIVFDGERPNLEVSTPALGQDNHAVLSGLLDYSDEQIADLEQRGIIASKNR